MIEWLIRAALDYAAAHLSWWVVVASLVLIVAAVVGLIRIGLRILMPCAVVFVALWVVAGWLPW
jgi:hypothetical protein